MKLISIVPAINGKHKYTAKFEKDDGKTIVRHFGSAGMKDFTLFDATLREQRKKLYLQRHSARENWTDPTTAGSLSRWILWNLPTVSASIADFKKRFNL